MSIRNGARARRIGHGAVSLGLVAALALSGGCAQSTAEMKQQYVDASDSCSGFRTAIIDARSTDQQDRIQQALAGAVLAAALTSAIAAASGDNKWWQKGLYAGAAGALVGYSKAYFEQKAKENTTRDQLLRSVDGDARAESARLTTSARAVNNLRDCRNDELETVRKAVASGGLKRDAAQAQLLAIRDRVAVDNRLVTAMLDGADKRVTSYVDTTAAASNVNAELLASERRDQQAREAKRKVRQTSPNVVKVQEDTAALRATDAAAQQQFDQRLQAMLVATG
ncbi:MAG: hypothetical protein VYD87_17750 [Pseudomonadota bacterium]|nr:hypothetical protein [Pseudomonadota bacterium]MEE3101765.1 hypothetical protein [Pseudomonadota bacterium]